MVKSTSGGDGGVWIARLGGLPRSVFMTLLYYKASSCNTAHPESVRVDRKLSLSKWRLALESRGEPHVPLMYSPDTRLLRTKHGYGAPMITL